MSNRYPIYALAAGMILTFASSGMGQGLIIPAPPERLPIGPSLPIQSYKVQTTINEQVAVTHIEQVFFNPYKQRLEGTYMLAVPEGANISKFTLEVDGEQVKAEVLDKDKAESIYQSIVRKQRDPGILAFSGKGLIQARVFPIEPEKTKKIEIRYEEILPYDRGVCRYQYALATEKICKKPIDYVEIKVDISNNTPIKNIYSPSHEVKIERDTNFKAHLKYSDENVLPENDFQLIYTVSTDPIGINVLTFKEEDKDGFFLLMAAPEIPKPESVNPKDVIFVLDKSGSMKGNNKIEQAKEALEFCVRSLNKEDRFAVVIFSDEIETLTGKLTSAGKEEIDSICKKIKEIDASGGTNIDGALKTALRVVEESSRPTYVLFLTDGRPTVGERDIKEILAHVQKWNEFKCRIFAFGVGFDVNTALLDEISQKNKGLATYVKPNEDIEVSVSSMYAKIADPVLSDLELDFGSLEVSKIYPKELPDLFSGSQLVVLGRYEEGGTAPVTLSGKVGGEKKKFTEEFTFTKENTKLEYIPRLWAARRIGYLMNEIRLNGHNQELVEEIIELSRKYGILTEYTAFLVKEDVPLAMRPAVPEPVSRRAGEVYSAPSAGRFFGGFGMAGNAEGRALSESVGKEAVVASEVMQDQLQRAESLSTQNVMFRYDEESRKKVEKIQGVRYAGQQAFFQRGSAWISTQFDEKQPAIKVKPYSDAYFQLADLSPEIAKILSIGTEISFVHKGQMIQITENGQENLTEEQLKILQ
ncbi:MAG TPA: VIT and VWA domain-containing protein [bacterium]|nr:VIT and VWA domain-containing protein [bacterium]HPO99210.1 VIT and VWA domain-containing protein [bacterium]